MSLTELDRAVNEEQEKIRAAVFMLKIRLSNLVGSLHILSEFLASDLYAIIQEFDTIKKLHKRQITLQKLEELRDGFEEFTER